jgi:hypothetical protein
MKATLVAYYHHPLLLATKELTKTKPQENADMSCKLSNQEVLKKLFRREWALTFCGCRITEPSQTRRI